MTIEWSRLDLPRDQYVYFRRNGQECVDTKNHYYEGRTSLFMDEVKKDNVSLKLSRVRLSDEGNYTCFLPEILKEFTVQLIVDNKTDSGSKGREGELTLLSGNADTGSKEEISTVGEFPWWVWTGIFISISIIIIIISVALLLFKKRKVSLSKTLNPYLLLMSVMHIVNASRGAVIGEEVGGH